jgi:hypothetical protein
VDSKAGRASGSGKAAARKALVDLDTDYELDGLEQDSFEDLDEAEPEGVRQTWAEMEDMDELGTHRRPSRKKMQRH